MTLGKCINLPMDLYSYKEHKDATSKNTAMHSQDWKERQDTLSIFDTGIFFITSILHAVLLEGH